MERCWRLGSNPMKTGLSGFQRDLVEALEAAGWEVAVFADPSQPDKIRVELDWCCSTKELRFCQYDDGSVGVRGSIDGSDVSLDTLVALIQLMLETNIAYHVRDLCRVIGRCPEGKFVPLKSK